MTRSGRADRSPFFSVVVPAFQCEGTLRECVDSVLSQGRGDVEVVLVDDGSTDGTGAICDWYEERCPDEVTVVHKGNEGPLAARIDGIRASRGRYLLFLDADDKFEPNLIDVVRGTIAVHGADLVIFNHYRCTGANKILCPPLYEDGRVFEGESLSALRSDAVLGPNLNALWQKCVRRDLLEGAESLLSYGRMIMGEDKLLSLRVIDGARRVSYVAEGLYDYRVHTKSLSHDLGLKQYQDMELVYAECERCLERWGLRDEGSLLARDRVELGLSCLNSLAAGCRRPWEGGEFYCAARYLSGSRGYGEACERARASLPLRRRALCWLLLRGNYGSLRRLLCLYARAKGALRGTSR